MEFWELPQILARIQEVSSDNLIRLVALGQFIAELLAVLVGAGVLAYGSWVALKSAFSGKDGG